MRQAMNLGAIVVGLGLAVLTSTSVARLVSVRCCVHHRVDFFFAHAMTGPGSYYPEAMRFPFRGMSCILGFDGGPNSERLIAAQCSDYPLPDQSDSHCSGWVEEASEVTHRCWGGGGGWTFFHEMWDIDGDFDVDLRDFAEFQNTFEWPGD